MTADLVDKLLALMFSLMILLQAIVVQRVFRTWLSPAGIFSVFWFGYTFIPLLILPAAPVEPLSVAFIFVCLLAFSASAVFFDWRLAFASNSRKQLQSCYVYDNFFCRAVFWIAIGLALIFFVINSQRQGIAPIDLFFSFFESAARYAQMRYSEEIEVNIFGQLSLVLSYLGVAIGGLIYDSARERRHGLLIIIWAFLPSVLVMITQSAKGLFLLSIVMFFAAVLVGRMNRNNLTLIESSMIKRGTAWALVVVPVLIISFMSRGLYEASDTNYVVDRLIFYFVSYSCGHLYAFSDWFSHFIGEPSVMRYVSEPGSYGFYTFMAIFRLFGIDRVVPLGVYDEYFFYGDILSTNVYTIFRGLILDFGIVGAVGFMFASGLFLNYCFFVLLLNRRPVVTVAVFIFMVGYFFSSFIISVLIWNSIYVSFFLLVVVLSLNNLLANKARPVMSDSAEIR